MHALLRRYRPFSAREGLLPEDVIQIQKISTRLRNRSHGVLTRAQFEMSLYGGRAGPSVRAIELVEGFFGDRFDEIFSGTGEILTKVSKLFEVGDWNVVYDFLEFTLANSYVSSSTEAAYNVVLEHENAGYRFVGSSLVPVTEKTELDAIREALENPIAAARDHIANAIAQLAVRPEANYAKVVAEALQAVEAAAKYLVGSEKATLGEALRRLKRNGEHHTALLDVFLKLYGWSSDEGGVRHAFKGEPVDQALAKFVLISCSAFVGYLTELKAQSVKVST